MKKPKGKNIEVKAFERELYEEFGYFFCQESGRSNDAPFSVHHLIFKSEKPNHKEINNKRNLIMLGFTEHKKAHQNKHEWRAKYIKERNLVELFGNDIIKH